MSKVRDRLETMALGVSVLFVLVSAVMIEWVSWSHWELTTRGLWINHLGEMLRACIPLIIGLVIVGIFQVYNK